MICIYVLHVHCQKALDNPSTSDRLKKAARAILDHSYVDDIVLPLSLDKEAINMHSAMDELLAPASFHIKKWVTNKPYILLSIPKNFDSWHYWQTFAPAKILSMNWDPKTDCYSIADFTTSIAEDKFPTKHSILSLSAKINFDPLGYTQPFVLMAQLILLNCFHH